MPKLPLESQVSELQFSILVDELKSEPARSSLLIDLLCEDNPIYDQRGAAAITRMRGWVLLAFEHLGLPEAALIFVLEELDNGRDAYLVAAAARSLRSYAHPVRAMTPFLARAIANIQFHDDLVCLDRYGGYAISQPGTTAVSELLATLRWLGPSAEDAMPGMEALLADNAKGGGALSQTQLGELCAILESIRRAEPPLESISPHCCTLPISVGTFREWIAGTRPGEGEIGSTVFEDQDGNRVKFGEFFRGRPSIVVFFYTRCTNPLKCSLTVAKLARLQKLLIDRGLGSQIRTAAITYDPAFDLPERLRSYGKSRGVHMDADNRLLRTVKDIEPLRAHFRLGVNFIESLVNRHRVEVYILDTAGSITTSFERVQWDEREILDRAAALLAQASTHTARRRSEDGNMRAPATASRQRVFAQHPATGSTLPATLSALSLTTAFFPKCPICWATYLSVFGITGLEQLPYTPWLLPLFAGLMLINLGSLWLREHARQRIIGFYFSATGVFAILILGIGFELEYANLAGVILTLTGSLLGVFASEARNRLERSIG